MTTIEHRRFEATQDLAIDALKECSRLKRSNFILRHALHACRRKMRPLPEPTMGRRLF